MFHVARPITLLCTILALTMQPHAAAKDQATELPGVTVQRQHNPLKRSDRRLGQLKKSLPELGGEAAPGRGDRARDYLAAHADAEAASGQQRQMMEKARLPAGPAPGTP